MTTGYWDKTTERHPLTVLEAEIPIERHRANAKVWSVLAPPRDSGKNLSPRPSQILGRPLLPRAQPLHCCPLAFSLLYLPSPLCLPLTRTPEMTVSANPNCPKHPPYPKILNFITSTEPPLP